MRKNPSIVNILRKYQQDKLLSASEERELKRWLEASEGNQLLFDELSDSEKWNKELASTKIKEGQSAVWRRIETALEYPRAPGQQKRISWRWYAAAALISGLIFGAWFLIKRKPPVPGNWTAAQRFVNDLAPATSHATLTFGSGRTISLDTVERGPLNASSLWKTDSNSLTLFTGVSNLQKEELNTLVTAPGTQYRIVLSDSSTVWLNAGSRLQFPSHFNGRERKVVLFGEGYFEVAKNRERPFLVQTGNATITVMGTHFNVRNYENENAQKTTLLEGSVKVQSGNDSELLTPGNQTFLPRQGKIQIIPSNGRQAVAWRENLFWFQSTPFEEIMGELKRWYPVRIHQTDLIRQRFTGILPRNRSLIEVLKILEMPGYVEFRLSGNDLEVMARKPR